MVSQRHSFLPGLAVASVLCLGGFAGGYFLFRGPRIGPGLAALPPAIPASTTAAAPQRPHVPVLRVTRALYGDLPDGASADVTGIVADHVTNATLILKAGNDLFGDPAAGIVKKLRVDYTIDGTPGTRTVDENNELRIVAVTGPQRLKIVRAAYGDLPDGKSTDVTEKVRAAVTDDSLEIPATNDNFGDPASGIVKKLRVDYTLNGTALSETVNEGDTLTISNLPP